MHRHTRGPSRKSNRKPRNFSGVVLEVIESRILLSGTFTPPVWAGEFSGPPATSGGLINGPVVTTVDPVNGNMLVAFNTYAADGDLVVAAFKSDGSGGLELDTSFGGQSNDGDISPTSGYEVIDMDELFGVDVADAYTGSGMYIDPSAVGISVESSGEEGSGNIDLLFAPGVFFDGGCGFGIVQLTHWTGSDDAWGQLNTGFGNPPSGGEANSGFSALAEDLSNVQNNLGAYGAEIIDLAPQLGGSYPGYGAFGNGIVYDSFSDEGAGDILVAGAVGPADIEGLDYGAGSGGAVFALNCTTGAFDPNFFSTYGGDALTFHPDTNPDPPSGDPLDCEGEADAISVNPSNGEIYVAGTVRDSAPTVDGDAQGDFIDSFAPDGSEGNYFTISNLATSSTNLDLSPDDSELDDFGRSIGVQVVNNGDEDGDVVAGFSVANESGYGTEIIRLNASLTDTEPLWSGGPDTLWVSVPSYSAGAVDPAPMAINPSDGDIAIAYFDDSAFQAVWISGSSGDQETLSNVFANPSQGGLLYSPVFQSDGSLTIAGVIGPGYDGTPPNYLTLEDYQFDNAVPAWLSESDGLLSWNSTTQQLDLYGYGSATIIANPEDYGDDPNITVNGSSSFLSIDPTTDTTVQLNSLTLENIASAQMAEGGSPDALILDLNSLSIDATSYLDATNNVIFIDYGSGPDPISTIASYLATGFNGGAWTGKGIDSSAAAETSGTGTVCDLGYGDGVDGEVAGLVSGQIEIKYTLAGDTNLDGTVNAEDYTPISRHYGAAGDIWDQGDMNYDGFVNSEDYTIWSANDGKSL
jgi:hypothetical protein